MKNSQDSIGQFIISGSLGIGEIVEVTDMGDRGEFFRVSFSKSRAINFLSVKKPNGYRYLATKERLESAINTFKQPVANIDFSSNQEKITFFKESLKENSIEGLAKSLAYLNQESELHTSLKKPFDNALDSFIQEIEFVYEIKNLEAWDMLGLSKNKK